jgi:hypothetical protein
VTSKILSSRANTIFFIAQRSITVMVEDCEDNQ